MESFLSLYPVFLKFIGSIYLLVYISTIVYFSWYSNYANSRNILRDYNANLRTQYENDNDNDNDLNLRQHMNDAMTRLLSGMREVNKESVSSINTKKGNKESKTWMRTLPNFLSVLVFILCIYFFLISDGFQSTNLIFKSVLLILLIFSSLTGLGSMKEFKRRPFNLHLFSKRNEVVIFDYYVMEKFVRFIKFLPAFSTAYTCFILIIFRQMGIQLNLFYGSVTILVIFGWLLFILFWLLYNNILYFRQKSGFFANNFYEANSYLEFLDRLSQEDFFDDENNQKKIFPDVESLKIKAHDAKSIGYQI